MLKFKHVRMWHGYKYTKKDYVLTLRYFDSKCDLDFIYVYVKTLLFEKKKHRL